MRDLCTAIKLSITIKLKSYKLQQPSTNNQNKNKIQHLGYNNDLNQTSLPVFSDFPIKKLPLLSPAPSLCTLSPSPPLLSPSCISPGSLVIDTYKLPGGGGIVCDPSLSSPARRRFVI